ncbi:two pore domain potassium channel family protein [Candidatus Woesearchaeota archaeon]|nr:two pore domain potassium channel family protein [Candidatus Woesearchaeota archaeon]
MSKGKPKQNTSKPKDRLLKFLDRVSFSQTFLLWLLAIILFAAIYFMLSYTANNSLMYMDDMIEPNAKGLMNSVYFSFITATTLGYGDIAPTGPISKFFAAAEVVIGLIIWALVISKLVGVKQEIILEEVYDISYEEMIDRQRSALYLFRSDVNKVIEKIEGNAIKQREVRDLWILVSGLDVTLSNIKKLIMPGRSEKYYYKNMDVFRLELLLNSLRLSTDKLLDLIVVLKANKLEWRNDMMVSSINEDVKTIKDIIDSQASKMGEKKVAERINELKKLIGGIEQEMMGSEEDKKEKKSA